MRLLYLWGTLEGKISNCFSITQLIRMVAVCTVVYLFLLHTVFRDSLSITSVTIIIAKVAVKVNFCFLTDAK